MICVVPSRVHGFAPRRSRRMISDSDDSDLTSIFHLPRDEPARRPSADTQIDMEMAFVTPDDTSPSSRDDEASIQGSVEGRGHRAVPTSDLLQAMAIRIGQTGFVP